MYLKESKQITNLFQIQGSAIPIARKILFGLVLLLSTFQYFPLSAQNRDDEIAIKTLINQGKVIGKTDTAQAFRIFNKAIENARLLNKNNLVAEAYFESAEYHAIYGQSCQAIQGYQQAALLFEQSNMMAKACKAYIQLGSFLFDYSDFDGAIEAFNAAQGLSKYLLEPLLQIEIQIGLGKVFTKQGDIAKAMSYFVFALELSEQVKYDKGRGDAWNQIGVIHWKEGKNRDALSAYKKALDIREQMHDSLGIAESFNNIGIIHKLEGDYVTARRLYESALGIRQKFNYTRGVGQTLFNMGSLQAERGLFNEALPYYEQSFEIKNELQDDYGKLACFLNMGMTYIELNQMAAAEQSYNEGLALSIEMGAADYSKSFHRELSFLFEKQHQFEKAFYHHVKYMAVKDTLINISNRTTLAELQAKYNLSENQRNIDKLTLDQMLVKEKYKREVFFRNALIAIVLLVVLLVFVLFHRGHLLRNKNRQLQAQKSLIEQREGEKEDLLREMHHRVKNNLQLVSGLLNLQARKMKDLEASQSLIQARDRIHTIGLIHQRLYTKDEFSKINLTEYIPDLCNAVMQANSEMKSGITIQYKIDPILISVDMAISVGLIINEAIINSLKYAFIENPHGLIEVSALDRNDHIVVMIKDNGIGISEIHDVENFGGFGFQLLRSFAKKLAGTLQVENQQGTLIQIQIPLRSENRKTGNDL